MIAGYREHRVASSLAPYVACYWTAHAVAGHREARPVVPDGCIDLLFESREQSLRLVGTMTRALWHQQGEAGQFVGVRFKAGGAVPFVRDRADLLTDEMIDAAGLLGRAGDRLRSQLVAATSSAVRVSLVERFLLERVRVGANEVEPRIAWATARLVAAPETRVTCLADELGVSRQYLRRLFLHHTGLAPKGFARIARLDKLVTALGTDVALVDAAFSSGYADQAHMSREFKELVGVAPAAFRASL